MLANLPDAPADVFTYAAKITELSTKLGFEANQVNNEFVYLLFSLLDDHNHEFCLHKGQNDPVEFWARFLSTSTVEWKPSIRKLIEHVLALPIATAEVERGFSILMHARDPRRNRLTVKHLRDIMFLRINGPDFESFDALRYRHGTPVLMPLMTVATCALMTRGRFERLKRMPCLKRTCLIRFYKLDYISGPE